MGSPLKPRSLLSIVRLKSHYFGRVFAFKANMKFLRKITITLVSALIALPAWAQISEKGLDSIPVDTMIVEGEADAPVQKVQAGYFETNGTQVEQILHETIESNKGTHTQLVITTDSPGLYEEVEKHIENSGSKALGILSEPQTSDQNPEAKASLVRRSLGYAKDSFKKDPIGVVITTVVVGADIWMWVHASQYSSVTMAGNILTDLVVNLGLSLRKNAWAEINNKLASKVVAPILKTVGFKNLDTPRSELMVKMISNFTMVITVQAVRLEIGRAHV